MMKAFKEKILSLRVIAPVVAPVIGALFWPAVVLAVDLKGLAANFVAQGSAAVQIIELLAIILGLVLIIYGGMEMWKAGSPKSQGGSYGRGIVCILIGGGVASVVALLISGSETIFGSDQVSDNLNTLGV